MSTLNDENQHDIAKLIGDHFSGNWDAFLPQDDGTSTTQSNSTESTEGNVSDLFSNTHLDPNFTKLIDALKSVDFSKLIADEHASDPNDSTTHTGSSTSFNNFAQTIQDLGKVIDSIHSAITTGDPQNDPSTSSTSQPDHTDFSSTIKSLLAQFESHEPHSDSEASQPIVGAITKAAQFFDSTDQGHLSTSHADIANDVTSTDAHIAMGHDFIF